MNVNVNVNGRGESHRHQKWPLLRGCPITVTFTLTVNTQHLILGIQLYPKGCKYAHFKKHWSNPLLHPRKCLAKNGPNYNEEELVSSLPPTQRKNQSIRRSRKKIIVINTPPPMQRSTWDLDRMYLNIYLRSVLKERSSLCDRIGTQFSYGHLRECRPLWSQNLHISAPLFCKQ